MKKGSTRDTLGDHSQAKVELFSNYVSKFLNILERSEHVEKIYFADLMCGEGIYSDGKKGSPVVLCESVKEHYFKNKKQCKDITIWFNDVGRSDVEKERTKIERVEEACSRIFKPKNVKIEYTERDFKDILPGLIERIEKLKAHELLLLFIDPWGYKDLAFQQIKSILVSKRVELLWFLPITPMYRFAKMREKPEALNRHLEFFAKDAIFVTQRDFLAVLKDGYRQVFAGKFFVDTFTLQSDASNNYALFFFTPHHKGFETMLRTKWDLDKAKGEGFRIESDLNTSLLERVTTATGYEEELRQFIELKTRTNNEIFMFGLKKGYLPKHTGEILRNWQKHDPSFRVFENGKPARKGTFRINSKSYSAWKNNVKIGKELEFFFKGDE